VVLLVPGAAGLFLLVDLGRYIRGLRPAGNPGTPTAVAAGGSPTPLPAIPRRSWRPRRPALRFLSSRTG
jgi:hypothetical protein